MAASVTPFTLIRLFSASFRFCGVNASLSRNSSGVVLWLRPSVIKDIAGVCVARKRVILRHDSAELKHTEI
jgi:hypothetical protein